MAPKASTSLLKAPFRPNGTKSNSALKSTLTNRPSSSTKSIGSSKPPSDIFNFASDPKGITEFSSEDDFCPVCKSDRFLNPKLRLLVSKCYHRMCESCIDRIYVSLDLPSQPWRI